MIELAPATDLEATRGRTVEWNGTATRFNPTTGLDEPIDLSLDNTTVRFTVKRYAADSDADAVFALSSPSSGVTFPDAENGKYRVTLTPVNWTAAALTRAERLLYDVQLTEPAGRVSSLANGLLFVSLNITNTSP